MLLEKRRAERSHIFLIVEFKPFNTTTEYSLGVTNNVSPHGFSLDSQVLDFKPGQTIECNLKQPDSDFFVSATGEIVWKRDSWYSFMAGIKFTEIDENAKKSIADLISVQRNRASSTTYIKDADMHEKERSLSQEMSKAEDRLLKAFHIRDEDVSGTGSVQPDKNDETTNGIMTDEIKIIDKIEGEKTASAPDSDINTEEHPVRARPSYKRRIVSGDIKPVSGYKKEKKHLYIGVITVAVIALLVMLYLDFGSFKKWDNNTDFAGANSAQSQQSYMGEPLTSDNESMNNISSEQGSAPPGQPENILMPDNKKVNLDIVATNMNSKDISYDGHLQTDADFQNSSAVKAELPRNNNLIKSDSDKKAELTADSEDINIGISASVLSEKADKKNQPVIESKIESVPVPLPPKKSQPVIESRIESVPVTLAPKKSQPVIESRIESVPVTLAPKKDIHIYEDTFSDNRNKWEIFDTNMASAKINSGEYIFENKRKKGPHIVFSNYDLPDESNFMTEASIRTVTNSGNYASGQAANDVDSSSYGFVFGAKDSFNNYTFQIIDNGLYSISRYRNGSLQELVNGKINNAVYYQNKANILKIVKMGDILKYYINDSFVYETSNLSFFGNKVGFIVNGELKIAVDNIRTQIQ